MNITFSLDTDNSGDKFKLACFCQAEEMYWALKDIKDKLRSTFKYPDPSLNFKERDFEVLEIVSDRFFEIIEENKVDLDLDE